MTRLMVLNDGETYTNVSGCFILDVPDEWDADDIEAAMADTCAFGDYCEQIEGPRLRVIDQILASHAGDSRVDPVGLRSEKASIERRKLCRTVKVYESDYDV